MSQSFILQVLNRSSIIEPFYSFKIFKMTIQELSATKLEDTSTSEIWKAVRMETERRACLRIQVLKPQIKAEAGELITAISKWFFVKNH